MGLQAQNILNDASSIIKKDGKYPQNQNDRMVIQKYTP